MSDKHNLRQQILAKRKAFAASLSGQNKADIAQKLLLLFQKAAPLWQKKLAKYNPPIIGGYQPFKSEIDCQILLDLFRQKNWPIAFPKVIDEENMIFTHEITKEPICPNFFIIPLIAFDELGYRTGYGKGYYDRYLANLYAKGHDFFTLGLAYELQHSQSVYPEAHDQKLMAILTEKQLYIF